ncbi:MAG: phospholipase D-like domain-containing protein [Bacteroidota bacterium]|nr:phospholipase D-like domain-containing protein [Bacteroidota bacterium]
MKRSCFILLFFVLFPLTVLKTSAQDDFELVESVPLETNLDQSNISRTLDVWLKMINDAKEKIDIETFYFANEKGKPLEQVMNALKNAAGRGVTVRIIVDSSFYNNNEEKSINELEGIQNIFIQKIPMGRIAGGVMHAKYFIVDNENLFIGSQNMDWRALIHIHELGARIKNKELANSFSELFATDWEYCGEIFSNQIYGNYSNSSNTVTINSNKYGNIILYPAFSPIKLNFQTMNSEEEELLKIINNVKDSLLIQMYSYSPKAKNEKNYYDTLDNALRDAASRGLKIKIIFSDWAIRDAAIDFIKNLSTVNNVQIKFSSIPQFSEGFIPFSRVDHCKYFIADNFISWISTSNWEWGYFYNSRNATLIIENVKINSELSEVFYRSWNGPYTNYVDINKKYEPVKRN